MLEIKQTIIVEGKYDKIKLKSVTNANIIATNGFRIYNDVKKRELIKQIAEKTGVIILTDSDNAGRKIRNFVKSCCLDNKNNIEIINAYVPKINGVEKRKKNKDNGENILGVEGIEKEIIIKTLERFAKNPGDIKDGKEREITKTDFYLDGLSGGKDSAKKRADLCRRLDICDMSVNSLLECVNILLDYEEYKKLAGEIADY